MIKLFALRRFFLSLSFVLLVAAAGAQGSFPTLSNLSPRVKWRKIETQHFRVIYPEGFGKQGQRMANTLEHIYAPVSSSLGRQPLKRTPIILQNHHSVANGFVTLGPRRSEFYTSTPQNANLLGNNDWLDMLAIHEFRHVVQYDRSRTGLTGFLYYFLGEFTQNAVASGTVPSWFWEGDAVNVETALTTSGRGRIPHFSRGFRANLLELGEFNYSKQYLRSYKTFIPNHYVLGYHLNGYMREQYGTKAMERVVERTWDIPIIPFAHSFAMELETSKKMPQLYKDMMKDLKTQWSAELSKESFTNFRQLNKVGKKVYTNYEYPQFLDDGTILALKSGLGDIEKFVAIDPATGQEKKVFVPGRINNSGMLSVKGGTLVWSEFQFDPRWSVNTYSVIKTYNTATKNYKTLTHKTRLSGASLSPDRSVIAAVETPTDYSCNLVLINAFNGERLRAFAADPGSFYAMPAWTDSGSHIILLQVNKGKKRMIRVDATTGAMEELLPYSNEHLTAPFVSDSVVYYSSALTGVDNVYALDLASGKRFRVTSSKYGAYNPAVSPDGKVLVYSDYGVLGGDIVQIDLDRNEWEPIEDVQITHEPLFAKAMQEEGKTDLLASVPDSTYFEDRYRKKFLNVHSWGPFWAGDFNSLELGIYSQNVLSTSNLFLGYQFDIDGNGKGIFQYSFQGLYPIIDLITTYGVRRENIPYTDTLDVAQVDRHRWNELNVKVGPRIPWNLTSSKYSTAIVVSNYVGFTSVSNYTSSRLGEGRYFGNLNNGNLLQNEFRFQFSNFIKASQRDVKPRWGQLILLEQYGTPYGGDFDAGLTAVRGQLYFPGIGKHHSLNFLVGYQGRKLKLSENEFWFNNRMPYPRGYSASIYENFTVIRSNYELPLIYPDLRLGPFAYIQRIKANLFYDFGYGQTDVINRDTNLTWQQEKYYESLGADLTFDFNVMRALPQLELGVRFIYVPELSSTQFEFLIGNIGF